MNIPTLYETKRGCGYRKQGGLYMMSTGVSRDCGKLPLPLCTCPTCGAGIKPARGWTWVNADVLFADVKCRYEHNTTIVDGITPEDIIRAESPSDECQTCPIHHGIGKAGLLWIGEKFYPTSGAWVEEARHMGVSRRIPHVPKEFEIGKTWVLAAHRKGIERLCPECTGRGFHIKDGGDSVMCEECGGSGVLHTPAIFHVFCPDRVEYVVKDDDTEEKLEKIAKRGIRPVRVVPVGEEGEQLPLSPAEAAAN